MITIAALFSAGLYPQLKAHLQMGKAHGITKQEAVEIVTQLAVLLRLAEGVEHVPDDRGNLER
jgi:alkylhydroperoxidase/carboxymuconolactone decarboxylase family protein YurZ